MEKIRRLNRSEINDVLWATCLTQSSSDLIYLNTWYLDVVCDQWEAYVLEEDGQYLAMLPFSWKSKKGVNYVYPPFFVQQLSVISAEHIRHEFQKAALSLMAADFKFIEYYLSGCKVKLNPNFKCEERVNCQLNLNSNYESLSASYSSNHKRNLKKFAKADLSIIAQEDEKGIDDIIELFKADRGKSSSFSQHDYHRFSQLTKAVTHNAKLQLLKAYSADNNLICGAVLYQFKNRLIFVFSGNSASGKENAALFGILDHVIKTNAGKDILLDFEGSQQEGLQKFYLGFGSKIVPYHFLKLNRLPFPLNLIKK